MKTRNLLRYTRYFKRGGQLPAERPWLKYSRRGRPSTIKEQNPSAVAMLMDLFFGKKETTPEGTKP